MIKKPGQDILEQRTPVPPSQPAINESATAIGQSTDGSSSTNQHVLLIIRKVLLVRAPVMLAFDYFTRDINDWWPPMSPSGIRGLECHMGGRIYESGSDEHIHLWGRVTDWQPPLYLQLAWTRDQTDDVGTEVLIDFSSNGSNRTRLEFSHRGWKPHELKQYIDYRNYWDAVLISGYQDYIRRRRP
jgi:Activator of Hsp90 ATPase homolog 1-like protein